MNVTGRVQGVGFRYMTKMVADELGITGAVWNEENGSVSIEAVGTDEQMVAFIQKVKESPSPSGRVNHTTIRLAPELKETKNFRVTN